MASVVVDGLTLPISVGGHPALDFCNTRAGWGAPQPKEYLVSHSHLALWAAENGLLDRAEIVPLRRLAERAGDAAQQVLVRAVRFRDALYDVLAGAAAPASWTGVHTEVSAATAALRLRPPTPRRPHTARDSDMVVGCASWELVVGRGVDHLALPLLAVAWSAAGLLTSIDLNRVAACPGASCGWLFHDPRGRRRWCSMAWCGNRAKARRHSARTAAH